MDEEVFVIYAFAFALVVLFVCGGLPFPFTAGSLFGLFILRLIVLVSKDVFK